MTFKKLVGTIALASVSSLVVAPATAIAQSAAMEASDLKAEADAIVTAAYPAEEPGAAVIITRGGRVVYAAGRGLADVDTRAPITPDTVFRLGSIVKQFTAATILKLVEEGRVSLDDPVSRFFPDWPQPGAGATVRQVLNHTSGIQDFTKIPGWIAKNRTRPFTTAEMLAVFRDLPARAQPGHAWEYNNGGYVLLGAIIEKVTGQAWHEALAERITKPLSLRTIVHPLPGAQGPASARGYTRHDGRVRPVPPSHMSVAHAAGGLTGSVGDMARFADALHRGRLVSPALYREMTRPAPLAGGKAETYGFGLRLREIRGRKALVHGGAGAGLDTDSVYIPSEDLFVAVFTNSDEPATDPSLLTRRLAALALGEPIPSFTRANIKQSTIAPLFGAYAAERGPPRLFFERDGKLFMARGEAEREAFAAGEDRFFFGPGELDWFAIARRPDGTHVMEMHGPELAAPIRATRSGPVPPPFTVPPQVLQTYAVTYKTETVEVAITVSDNGGLTLTPAGQKSMPMRPVSATEFMVDEARSRVIFHSENGKVNRLSVRRGARELHGHRIR